MRVKLIIFAVYSAELLALIIGCAPRAQMEEIVDEKPNFIFFIADDMYPDMFNNLPEGKGRNLTPNIDRLANEGVFLSNLFVSSPVCTPSRYGVLTGNYASRATNDQFLQFTAKNEGQTAIQWNSFISPGVEKTIGTYLQALGYKSGFVGKNHVVESRVQVDQSKKPDLYADPNNPEVIELLNFRHDDLQKQIQTSGFDFADNLYYDNPNWLGIRALAYQNMDWITEAGVRFLDEYHDENFFLYFATTLPHFPTDPEHSWQADPRITSKGILDEYSDVLPARETLVTRLDSAGLTDTNRENLLWMDDALGALFKKLKEIGQIDNTIIFFFNDHGQEAKGTLYQGGIKSQGFVWKSEGFPVGDELNAPISNLDFLPTIVEFAGSDSVNCDGKSFLPALNGQAIEKSESMFFELGFARAVVKDGFKYMAIRYPEYALNYSEEERKILLEDYNEFRRSFGNDIITTNHTLPYGHLEMFPGGGGAEHGVYGKKPGFFDSDQFYDLTIDPNEEVNLVSHPAYEIKLNEFKGEMQKYVDDLPGNFEL